MPRLIILIIFFLLQVSLSAQYKVIKYQFNDSYEIDETYIKYKNKELALKEELNILRDSIESSKELEDEERFKALQLFNNLFSEHNDVWYYLYNQNDEFAWFRVMPRKKAQKLVSYFVTSTDICKMIRNIYSDLESNIFIQATMDLPDYIKRSIKFLDLKKDKKKGSILIRRLNSNIRVDKLLKNKDIYFGGYNPFDFDKLSYTSQFYAYNKFTKRKNNYYSLQFDTSQVWKQEYFDYIYVDIQLH